MGKVEWFKNYVQSLDDTFEEINRNRIVVVKSQLTKFLNSHKKNQNLLLLGILPDFSGKGNDADSFKLVNITQFYILKKTTYSEVDHDELMEIYEETYIVIEKVLKKILEDSLSYSELRFLNTNSIKLEPVFDMDGCNGWKLMLNFDMFV
ncbi:MAG: hypothetical protein CMO82_11270 [Winogradskyella sp.]|nr:hypothetical protein [Winogradskyella sp.]|tara:strand:+ start:33071 stop:33520 length:450 start_codon:yes stop_codon:yes gene_type:complete